MLRRMNRMLPFLAGALMLAPLQTEAQERYRVLIPNFFPLEGANKDFGEKGAEELRELMVGLATHQPIEKKEIETSLKEFKMEMEDLDCVKTRQLASQMNANVALCAEYKNVGDQFVLTAAFHDIGSMEIFEVGETSVAEKQEPVAAQFVYDNFERYVNQISFTQFCADYARSQLWEEALRNCDQALALNPGAVSTRYRRAAILFESKRDAESLEELDRVLELNPMHEEALRLAGVLAARQEEDERARGYFSRFLELNPAESNLRMQLAVDLSEAGDPVGGIQLLQPGLEADPDNVTLQELYGTFTMKAAIETQNKAPAGSPTTPEAADYYRKAIQAYEQVYTSKGAETPTGHLRNIIGAYMSLDEVDNAILMSERALATHPQEDVLWSFYANALMQKGELDRAITALDKVKEINPSDLTAPTRQGNWLLQAGRVQEAVQPYTEVAQAEPGQADAVASQLFADVHANGIAKENWAYALQNVVAIKAIPNITPAMQNQLNFWHAWSIYNAADKEAQARTFATAQATLPKFQQALELFGRVGNYPASVGVNLAAMVENTNTFIEIQEQLIRRGR